MTKCKYNQNGCTEPIPVKCSDECAIAEYRKMIDDLIKEVEWLQKTLKECEEMHREKLKEYKQLLTDHDMLKGQYTSLLDRHNALLKEIAFTD